MSRLVDPRDSAAALHEIAVLSRHRPVRIPGSDTTWHDLLFDGDEQLTDLSRPDQALLAATADLGAGLADHLNQLPALLRQQWLADILRIPVAGAVPDRVPIGFGRDKGAASVEVPAGTEVRAKDDAGRERRYLTTEPIQARGVTVPVVQASRSRRLEAGDLADHAVRWDDRAGPFATFADDPGAPGVPTAGHRLRFTDPVLATDGTGTAAVTVRFDGGDAAVLTGATWRQSTATGPATVSAEASVRDGSASSVRVQLTGACAPGPGEAYPWLEVTLPPDDAPLDPTALGFGFRTVTLSVQVTGLAAQAAYAGDAKLDLTKAFEPFGPTPREGDALVVRSDEALGKPLTRLGLDVGRAGPSKAGDRASDFRAPLGSLKGRSTKKTPTKTGTVAAELVVEVWNGTGWDDTDISQSELSNMAGDLTGLAARPASDLLAYAGEPGHYLRLRLQDGDFGWAAFQNALGRLAATAGVPGATGKPSATELVPPEAPRLERLWLSYTTARVSPAEVTAYDGFGVRRLLATATVALSGFVTAGALGSADDAGTLDLGLDLPDAAIGGSVSLYLEVAPADVGASPGRSTWQVSTAAGWQDAAVADGTRGLRQSGLLRVLAPDAWTAGSTEGGDLDGDHHWLRLHSTEPGRLGTLVQVVPDAALGEQSPRPGLVSPDVALRAGQVKGLVGAVPGIAKVVGLAGLPGRAEEDDASYLRRASGYPRHRDRAVSAWDYEQLARDTVPGLAAVRCLPHTCPTLGHRPGAVALVVVPAGGQPMPVPTVAMAEAIEGALRPRMPVTATVAVVPPAYVAVTVTGHLVLARGVASLAGRTAVLDQLERWLHPALRTAPRFGGGLYASAVVTFLESLPEVDHVETFDLTLPDGSHADPVTVDPVRGLVASAGHHDVTVEEQL